MSSNPNEPNLPQLSKPSKLPPQISMRAEQEQELGTRIARVQKSLKQIPPLNPTETIPDSLFILHPDADLNLFLNAWSTAYEFVQNPGHFFSLSEEVAYFGRLRAFIIARKDQTLLDNRCDFWDIHAILSYVNDGILSHDNPGISVPRGHLQSISQASGELAAFLQRWDHTQPPDVIVPDEWKDLDEKLDKLRKFTADYVLYLSMLQDIRAIYNILLIFSMTPS
jgi:hypothetical protein